MVLAPVDNRFSLAAAATVNIVFPLAESIRDRAAVLLTGCAWAIKTSSAMAPTNRLRRSARAAVILVFAGRGGKGDRMSSRPALKAGWNSGIKRIPTMLRAGTQMTD